ncbi:MAG: DUF4214 domain-containing protein [Clostridiales bacterium]|nr:DUF4214 domain-containing protein [Clostridiales bacterium]
MKRLLSSFLASIMSLGILASFPTLSNATAPAQRDPYGRYGNIRVCNGTLCDERGNPVQLRGMSTHGIQWDVGEWVLDDNVFDSLLLEWKCDIVRIAMYVTENGYASDPSGILAKVEHGIELASQRGLYVIVDWHILNPGNPNDPDYLNAGRDLPQFADIRSAHPEYNGPQLFFAYMSSKYGDRGNVLFETANEPNNLNSGSIQDEWNNVLKPYHDSIVRAIRDNDKDSTPNIIICGTGNWDQYVDQPVGNPVSDPAGQVMYTLHFYAGTHDVGGDRWIEDNVERCLNAGLAVFCTEWGVSRADGNGGVFTENADRWLGFLSEHNISWCAWSLGRKYESSAAFDGNGNITEAGMYLMGRIREGRESEDQYPGDIVPVSVFRNTDPSEVTSFVERLYSLVLGRTSDTEGLSSWTDVLLSGNDNGGNVAKGFLFSHEFISRNVSDRDFVRILYRVFFNREGDTEGFNGWVSVLSNGGTREEVTNGFIDSYEWACLCCEYGISSGGNPSSGTVSFVKRMYTTCLGREFDPAGLHDWTYALANGSDSGRDVAYGFFESPEFINASYSDEEFVRRLYATFFDREPDQAGFDSWLNVLRNGSSRHEVLDGFIGSSEFASLCRAYGIRQN